MSESNLIRRAGLALALAGAMFAAGPVFAADAAAAKAVVDAAKARGEVGEQGDGYLGLVTQGASGDVRAAVTEINTGRSGAYRDAASKTGTTAEAAGQATARQLIDRAPPGQFVKPLDGSWARK